MAGSSNRQLGSTASPGTADGSRLRGRRLLASLETGKFVVGQVKIPAAITAELDIDPASQGD